MEWMTDFMSTFCKAVELPLDTCTSTLATAKACLKLPGLRSFSLRGKAFACSKDALPSLVEVCAKQNFNSDNDANKSEKVREGSRVF